MLCVLIGALALAATADAQTTTERAASILIFPKIVADSSADTIIQLSNVGAGRANASCSYIDGLQGWQATSFALELQAGQELLWTASRGREASQDGVIAAVPAAPDGLRGELLCVVVDAGGAPTGDDRLAGHATVVSLAGGDAAGYAALGLRGAGFNDNDEVLCIGGEPSDMCFIGAEYDACPAEWIVSHPADGAPDEQLGAGSAQTTTLTIAPCSQNVRDATPAALTVELDVVNAFEQHFSASADVTCWAELALADVGSGALSADTLGSDYATTTLRSAAGQGGFVVVAEVARHASSGGPILSRAALNPHRSGAADGDDVIIVPTVRP
jgi:hypothetical protein